MEKRKAIIAVIFILFLVLIFSVYYFAKNANAPEKISGVDANFQRLVDSDFSNVDPNMPEEVFSSLKDTYDVAQETLKNDPQDFQANMQKAFVLYQFRDFDKALMIYKKMNESKPENYESFKGLGDVYYQLKNYKEAESAYLTAVKNNPSNPNTYSQLVEIYTYHIKKDNGEIEKFFQEGIANLGANRFSLVQSYALFLESIGEYKRAIEQWEIVLDAFPDNKVIRERIKNLQKM